MEESIDRLCAKIGMRWTLELQKALARRGKWTNVAGVGFYDLEDVLEERRGIHHETDNADDEVGLLWLFTLDSSLREDVTHARAWVAAHIARRKAAIAADRSPRRVVRDGAGRNWVDGEWVGIRAMGQRMQAGRARKVARLLRRAHPGTEIKVVHILTPAPRHGDKR